MKHLKELKLNEDNIPKLSIDGENIAGNIGNIGYGWILDVSDEPKRGKGRGITEPYFIVTKRNNIDSARKIAMNMWGMDIDIKNIKPWNDISNVVWVEK